MTSRKFSSSRTIYTTDSVKNAKLWSRRYKDAIISLAGVSTSFATSVGHPGQLSIMAIMTKTGGCWRCLILEGEHQLSTIMEGEGEAMMAVAKTAATTASSITVAV